MKKRDGKQLSKINASGLTFYFLGWWYAKEGSLFLRFASGFFLSLAMILPNGMSLSGHCFAAALIFGRRRRQEPREARAHLTI